MITLEEKQEVARLVRESISQTRLPNGLQLEVEDKGVVATQIGNKTWWRVPIYATPLPDYLFTLYEALADVEGNLQDDRGLDILLFSVDTPLPASRNGKH